MKSSLSVAHYGPPGGRTIIFFHGFLGRGDDFLPVIDLLREWYRCVAFDLPGHGASLYRERQELEGITDFPSLARMILGDIDSLGAEKYSLYGYSMGGRVAQAVALAAPGRAVRLILESSSFGIGDIHERRERYQNDMALLEGLQGDDDFRAFLKKWYSLPLFRAPGNGELREKMMDLRMKNDVRELQRALTLLSPGNHPLFLPLLAGAGIPLSYLCGTEDEKYTAEARRGKATIPSMEVITFRDASHNIHFRFPGAVASTIRGILGD